MSDVYKENYDMRKEIELMRKSFRQITNRIYCIGGPLNDNVLGYTSKQLRVFSDIVEICRGHED